MSYDKRPIGVFDSGIGGLTAVRELIDILPGEDVIYLGDTARVPYGTRSRETILRYAAQDFEFLKKQGVKFIIAACGTASSVMTGESSFPEDMCTGVILPAVKTACETTSNKKIGVIATGASVRSGSYERLIKQIMPDATVVSKACPMFVPLVENGYCGRDCVPTVAIAREYLEPLRDQGIDTLILGCTHYPLLCDVISDILGDGVRLISSGAEAARYAKKLLEKNNLLSGRRSGGGIKLYCTDSPELFCESTERFLGLGGVKAEKCSLD